MSPENIKNNNTDIICVTQEYLQKQTIHSRSLREENCQRVNVYFWFDFYSSRTHGVTWTSQSENFQRSHRDIHD